MNTVLHPNAAVFPKTVSPFVRIKSRPITVQAGRLSPFVDALPIPGRLADTPVNPLQPLASRYYEYGNPNYYILREQEALHSFHRDLPQTQMWTYNGTFPGPALVHYRGKPTAVRRINDLNPNYRGFGIVETVLHHHGGWQDPVDDGWPMDFITPGTYKDYLIPNQTQEDERSYWASTLWYHDHMADHSSGNVYHGLAGVALQFDDVDSDNENDTNPQALRLPSGQYDVPLVFNDYILNQDGSLFFDQMEDKGQIGNLFCVNGKVQPYVRVAARKYRFRLLCASQARHYNLSLSNKASFHLIASDGGLLEAPLETKSVYMAPGERYEIIVDFSRYPVGTQLALINDVDQKDGNKPDSVGRVAIPQVLFVVDRQAEDPSLLPAVLQHIPSPRLDTVVATRRLVFHRRNGAWQINDRFWDPERPLFACKLNTAERWTIAVGGGGWHHPFHLHVENFRVLSRNGRLPPVHERGRKDVLNLPGGQEAEIFVEFHKYVGRYTVHCHNLGHEDLAMMGWVNVVR